MELINDIFLLPWYSFNYIFSLIIWIMVLSWIFSSTQVYEYRINFADFLYYCYEKLTDGIEWLMSKLETLYNKVVAFTKRSK